MSSSATTTSSWACIDPQSTRQNTLIFEHKSCSTLKTRGPKNDMLTRGLFTTSQTLKVLTLVQYVWMWYHFVSWIERACVARWLNQRLVRRLQVQIQTETQNLRALLIFIVSGKMIMIVYMHVHI